MFKWLYKILSIVIGPTHVKKVEKVQILGVQIDCEPNYRHYINGLTRAEHSLVSIYYRDVDNNYSQATFRHEKFQYSFTFYRDADDLDGLNLQ